MTAHLRRRNCGGIYNPGLIYCLAMFAECRLPVITIGEFTRGINRALNSIVILVFWA